MGLRSFFKKRFKEGKNEENAENNDIDVVAENIRNEEPEVISTGKKSAMSSSSKVSPFFPSRFFQEEDKQQQQNESVEDRIKRIKSGAMTEKEKLTFVKTALSRLNDESDNQVSSRPIRQQVPAIPDLDETKSKSTISSLSNLDKKRKDDYKKDDTEKIDFLDEKREYLNRVTDPDRFKGFRSILVDKKINKSISNSVTTGASSTLDDDDCEMIEKIPKELDDKPISSVSSTRQEEKSSLEISPSSLGSRLEKAAILREKIDSEKRLLKYKNVKLLQEEQLKRAQIRKQHELAAIERERNIQKEKERQVALEKEKEEELLKKKQEERRLLEKRQDEYWSNKLALEKEAKKKLEKLKHEKEDEYNQKKFDLEMQEVQAKFKYAKKYKESLPPSQPLQLQKEQPLPKVLNEKNAPKDSFDLDQKSEQVVDKQKAQDLARDALKASASKVVAEEVLKQDTINRNKSLRQQPDWNKLKQNTLQQSSQPQETTPKPQQLQKNIPQNDEDPKMQQPIRMKISDYVNPDDQYNTEIPIDEKVKANRWGINLDAINDAPDSKDKKVDTHQEAKEKASRWGINLDLLKE